MAYTTMYPSKVNSPETTLAEAYTVGDNHLHITDVSVLPAATNHLTVGTGEDAVTYSYTGKTGTTLGTVTGLAVVEGTDTAWAAGTSVARNFTSYDYEAFKTNIDFIKDHGNLDGLDGDDHTQYIKHDLSTAENDFLVGGTGATANTYVTKTLAETKTILFGASPKKSVIFRAGLGLYPQTGANPAEAGTVLGGSNKVFVNYYAFDSGTDEFVQALWWSPDNWDAGTVTAKLFWTATTGTTTKAVRWGVAGVSVGNDEAIDSAFGTEVFVLDTYLAAGDTHITDETSAITIAGATAGEPVIFRISRDANHESDDFDADAKLIAVKIEYGVTTTYSE